MNVFIVSHNIESPSRVKSRCECEVFQAAQRAVDLSITEEGPVTVEALGQTWLYYTKGRLTRVAENLTNCRSYAHDLVHELVYEAGLLDEEMFPRRFPLKLHQVIGK